MYDYNNGRFLSVDPFIQNPSSTQSLNPYTYIFNNPLSGVDPTGYLAKLDDDAKITKVEQFAPTGSNIKSGIKFSGVTASGDKFSISIDAGKIVGSSGIDFTTTTGASTKGGNNSEDKGNNKSVASKSSSESGGQSFVDLAGAGFKEFANDPDLLMNPISDALDQLTDNTSQKIARIEAELFLGNKGLSLLFKGAIWVKVYIQLGGKLPSGFKSINEFVNFSKALKAGLKEAGLQGTKPILQGSAVTGKSFTTGKAFDVGRKSDFDIALAGARIFKKAKNIAGLELRSGGTRTAPLTLEQIKQLGLGTLQRELSTSAGRPVEFMIFKSAEKAIEKAPSVVF